MKLYQISYALGWGLLVVSAAFFIAGQRPTQTDGIRSTRSKQNFSHPFTNTIEFTPALSTDYALDVRFQRNTDDLHAGFPRYNSIVSNNFHASFMVENEMRPVFVGSATGAHCSAVGADMVEITIASFPLDEGKQYRITAELLVPFSIDDVSDGTIGISMNHNTYHIQYFLRKMERIVLALLLSFLGITTLIITKIVVSMINKRMKKANNEMQATN